MQAKLADTQSMRRPVPKAAEDPRNLQPSVASVAPPPTKQLVDEHQTRLGERARWQPPAVLSNPATSSSAVPAAATAAAADAVETNTKSRKPRVCKKCKKPMKGHLKSSCV